MEVKVRKKTKKSKAVRMKRSESVDSLNVMALNPKPLSHQNFIKLQSCSDLVFMAWRRLLSSVVVSPLDAVILGR